MYTSISFSTGALSSFYAKGAKRIALIITVVLFCWITSIVVGSLAATQILVPLTWAQSEILAGDGGAVKEEGESATPKELEGESGKEQEVAQPQEIPDEELEEEEEIEENIADRIHAALSGYVSAAADKVDGFYDDERYADEINTTRIKLRVDYFLEKGEDPDLKLRFNLNLALPRINKRLKLLVSGKPDEEETDETGAGLGEEGEEDNV